MNERNGDQTVLSLRGVTKRYPGVTALDSVSLDFKRGEIHAIVGENGAGKSTIIKIIAGSIPFDDGEIYFGGNPYKKITPLEARQHGVEVVYQEHNLIESMSVAENICLGEKTGRFVNWQEMYRRAEEIFRRFSIDIDPRTKVRNLSVAQMQIVEIAKAVSKNVKVLIMDEPTAPLTASFVDVLMDMVVQLKKEGVTIIYISHRLEEIFQIADRVSVLRDGQHVITQEIGEMTRKSLIDHMVGRQLTESFPEKSAKVGEVALEVRNLAGSGDAGISFSVRKGEILGIAGLVGAGRTELLRLIYGADRKDAGEVWVNGKKVTIRSPKDALRHGIGLIPEDRKRQGCLLMQSVMWNTSVMCIQTISSRGFVDTKREKSLAEEYQKAFNIKAHSLQQKVNTLSGGNQQKVVLAKTLAANADVLMFDEPTRGIDIGAKQEIYHLIFRLASEGKAVIIVSSEMEELMGLSDRMLVMAEGRLSGELTRDEFEQRRIMEYASRSVDAVGDKGVQDGV